MTIMKRNRILPIFASALIAMMGACSGFDDSALWNDVDNIYTELTELASQLEQTNAQLRLLGLYRFQYCFVQDFFLYDVPGAFVL